MSDSKSAAEASYGVPEAKFDAVIAGAGFSGMYMLHRLRELGLSVRVYEAGTGVGGTWYWNRYPGARCDTESIEYSYSFSDEIQQEWNWTERYPRQPEILRYANYVADRLDLGRDIQFETRVTAAHYDDESRRWAFQLQGSERVSARYCIMATGCLSSAQVPDFKGLESFTGTWYHTGQWPHDGVDFSGKCVGVIGTGSSAIQSIPIIAQQADHVYVFQRTPNYSVPAHNAPLDPEFVRWVKANYPELRNRARETRRGYIADVSDQSALDVSPGEREEEYERRWAKGGLGFMSSFSNLLTSTEANDTAAEFVRNKIRAIVNEPDVAAKLMPSDYPIGTKRLCVDSHYFETFNRDNVTLVDVRNDPIEVITPHGLRTGTAEYELDSIVFATGFDAMTGTLRKIDIRGTAGITLREKWIDGPRAYLGLAIAGFPNLFTITGPGSPSVLSNMMVSIEQHIEWIAECIDYMETNGFEAIEADEESEDRWVGHVSEVANATLFPYGNSWWKGANVAGKPQVFMPYAGGVGRYRQICDEVAERGYEGFTLFRAPVQSYLREPTSEVSSTSHDARGGT